MIGQHTSTTPGRRSVAVGLLAVLGLLAAACGSDDAPQADTTSPAPEPTAAPVDTGGNDSAEPTTVPDAGDDWDAVVEAAREEGRVVWYGPNAPDAAEAIKAAFEAEYPEITVEFTRLTMGPITESLAAERETGADGADFFGIVDPPTMNQLNNDGYLAPITGPQFQDLSSSVFAENPLFVQVPNTVIFGGEAHFIIWNTDLVTEPITDFADILARADEFGDGALGVPDLTSIATAAVWTQVEEQQSGINMEAILGEDDLDFPFMEAMAALEPSYYEGAVPISQAVAAGEVKAGIMTAGILLKSLQDSGAPVDGIVSQTAPSGVSIIGGIPPWSQRPNAAQLFVDWLLSPAGQEAANGGGSVAIRDGIPGTVAAPAILNPPRLEVLTDEYKDAFINVFDDIFQR